MTVHDRYHITHPTLGLLDTAQSWELARLYAKNWSEGDDIDIGDITIFDSMARHQCPCEWEYCLDLLTSREHWVPIRWKVITRPIKA